MSWNPFSRSNTTNVKTGYNKKPKLVVIVVVVWSVLIGISLIVFAVQLLTIKGGRDSVIAAARKSIPNAVVDEIRVADGFAMAIVGDPAAEGQAGAGNITIFKENEDKTMTQIANGSSFSPVDLLNLGIPLKTQAKLTKKSLAKVKQSLADTCGYSGGDTLGYSGFDNSFNPDGWQIDSATLDGIKQALTVSIKNKNAAASPDKKIMCVKTTVKKSGVITDMKTYISTFTLELQFITSDGTITTHKFTFAIGPNHYSNYVLDEQEI